MMSHETDPFDELPEAIIERLRSRDRGVSMLTPRVDQTVVERARTQFAARRSRPAARRWYTARVAAAAAAVGLVALFIARPFDQSRQDAQRVADDVDGSGQVDILDAFALARARQADPGTVSQELIDALAERIVSLGPQESLL
jgi:hypothetical protein